MTRSCSNALPTPNESVNSVRDVRERAPRSLIRVAQTTAASSTPQILAITDTVRATLAGSLTVPRSGDRYGQSVSRRMRSRGSVSIIR